MSRIVNTKSFFTSLRYTESIVMVEWDASFVFKYVAKIHMRVRSKSWSSARGASFADCHDGTAVNISMGRIVRKSNK